MGNFLYGSPFSGNPNPDIPSAEHFDRLEREYLRAKARNDKKELYIIVNNIRNRIHAALSYKPPYDPLNISTVHSVHSFTSEPTELTKKYWRLEADLAREDKILAGASQPKHFKYIGDIEKLKNLFDQLKGHFAPETKQENFIHIFSPILMFEEWEPLHWNSSNRLLAYLLDAMCKRNLIDNEWQSIAGNGTFFLNKKGKVLTADDLAQAKSHFENADNPIGYETIDHVLSSIYKK